MDYNPGSLQTAKRQALRLMLKGRIAEYISLVAKWDKIQITPRG